MEETVRVTDQPAAGSMSDPSQVREAERAYQPGARSEDQDVWLFVRAGRLPDRWRNRAIDLHLVPLLSEEAAELLGRGAFPPSEPVDDEFLRLVASGASIRQLAVELRVSTRTVQARLADLRRRFGVESKAELAALLARKGF